MATRVAFPSTRGVGGVFGASPPPSACYHGSPHWLAKLCGKRIGRFSSEHEAALAWNVAAKERWGDFAFQNDVPVGLTRKK